jgi:hypothetical protein
LPVATASAKRVFAAMKFVKNQLCNKMSNWWLNDCLVTFTERDALRKINNAHSYNSLTKNLNFCPN